MGKKYTCPNGCKLPPREKTLLQHDDGTWGFGYKDFIFCPICGSLMPSSLNSIQAFFKIYHIHPSLTRALDLVYKSEFEAAAREAFVTVETILKKKSGLDSHGIDLATKALAYDTDKKTGDITKKPLIAINNLKTDSERNEQDGIRFMLMGFFQGPRNIFQHNHVGSSVNNVFSIIIEASFFLNILDGHSITKNGHWIRSRMDYADIYAKMPNIFDRWRLVRMLKKRERHYRKNKQ